MLNTPNIRFKGFTDPWEQRKFGDIAQRESETMVSDDDNPCVEYEDVISERGALNKDIYLKNVCKSGIKFSEEDVLYGKLRPYLHNWLNPDFTGVAVGDWWVLRPINTNKNFLYRLIQTSRYDDAANQSSGTKMPRADWKLISNLEFQVPSSIDEQSQIASVFDNLDSLITLHQRKRDELSGLKKCMLQKMFPKDGEQFPEIRFSGFTAPWEQRKLGEVFEERTERANGDEELLSVTIGNGVIRQVDSDKRNIASEDKSNYKIVRKGDVPYNSMRMWQGAVGNSEYDGIVSPAYTVLVPTTEANGKFFMELFKKESSLKIFQRWSQGLTSDTWNLKYPVLSSIEFYMPSVGEQTRIAEFFQSFDYLITLHQHKCDELKAVKKFMLQNMFPQKG